MEVRKKFDSELHSKNDNIAKEAMLRFLNTKLSGYEHIENPNKYGIDLLSIKNGKVYYCWELERREKNWKGDVSFPFDAVNCLQRKDHLWNRENTFISKIPFTIDATCKVYYVQMNDLCNRIIVLSGNTVLQYPLAEQKNRFVKNGELVRKVPISAAKHFNISWKQHDKDCS